jgi:hypothetical protein
VVVFVAAAAACGGVVVVGSWGVMVGVEEGAEYGCGGPAAGVEDDEEDRLLLLLLLVLIEAGLPFSDKGKTGKKKAKNLNKF